MNVTTLPPLRDLIRARRADLSLPIEERAVLENFGAEERVTPLREQAYAKVLGTSTWTGFDDFAEAHWRYLRQSLWTARASTVVPQTFDPDFNHPNFWPRVDDDVALYRLEALSFALRGTGVDDAEFLRATETRLKHAPGTSEHSAALVILQRVLADWNLRRDRRPAFATTSDEIRDVLADSGDDWPNALRDHLGLGHYNPKRGRTETVLLMRYTAAEVRSSSKAAGLTGFCIPTVLDGNLNPFFFPTPLAGPGAAGSARGVGRSVNLAPAHSESEYRMGLELVHSFVEYRAHHLVRCGSVSRPPAENLAELRGFHLSWLRLETERDDFGCDLNLV